MSNFESGNLRLASQPARLSRGPFAPRRASLLAAGALAVLLIVPLPLRAQNFDGSASSMPMGQLPQLAVGQEYQLSPDPDPNSPPQFQPVPNGDSDDPNMNSDDDNNSDDNADNGDNDQNQNDDNSDNDNSPDNSSSDDNSPPPSSN